MSSKSKYDTNELQKYLDQEVKQTRWVQLARHLATSMSLLSDTNVEGYVSHNLGAPAATSYVRANDSTGTLAREWLGGKEFKGRYSTHFCPFHLGDDLSVWMGTAWHELGHILYTPFGKYARITYTLNLLEDARIEALLIKAWPKTKPALMSTLRAMIPDISTQVDKSGLFREALGNYAWLAGRIHISQEVRDNFRSKCVESEADEVDRIYREYLALGHPISDIPKGIALARELATLLGIPDQEDQKLGKNKCGHTMGADTEGRNDGTPVSLDEEAASVGGAGGRGDDEGEAKATKDDTDKLREELEQYRKDESLVNEVEDLGRYLDRAAKAPVGREMVLKVHPPTGSSVRLANEVRRVAQQFNDTSAKGLVRYRDSGRLRPRRYELYDDLDRAFDQWEPGLEQEMDISLLIDVSGSMSQSPVKEVVYALEVGLEDVAEIRTAYFGSTYYTTPKKVNSAHRQLHPFIGGSTKPADGMAYLYHKIVEASATNKLLVIYTDGGWDDSTQYQRVGMYLEILKRQGVNMRVIGEGTNANIPRLQREFHGILHPTKEIHACNTLKELPDIVLGWTKTVLSKPIGGG